MSRYRRRLMMASQEKEEYIVFADPVVAQICATNWGDGIGITPSQAAAVTSINNNVFSYNTDITSFKELMYFTGLTTIGRDMFRDSTNLHTIGLSPNVVSASARSGQFTEIYITDFDAYLRMAGEESYPLTGDVSTGAHLYLNDVEVTGVVAFPSGMTSIRGGALSSLINITGITIPISVTAIGGVAFRRTGITTLTFPDGLQTIGGGVVNYCSALANVTITLPATVTSIGNAAFRYTGGSIIAVCLPTTPPTLGSHGMDDFSKIYVPYGYGATYQAANVWSGYASKIYELNPDGTIPS